MGVNVSLQFGQIVEPSVGEAPFKAVQFAKQTILNRVVKSIFKFSNFTYNLKKFLKCWACFNVMEAERVDNCSLT